MNYFFTTLLFFVIITHNTLAQSDTTILKKELLAIKGQEGVSSFAYAQKLISLTQAYQQAGQFTYSEKNIEQINSILQFFTDSIPPNYEIEFVLKSQINSIRIEQLFTAWQYHFLKKEYEVAQYVLEEKDWVNRAIILKKYDLVLTFLEQMHLSVGSYDKVYLHNWLMVYTFYTTSSHYNLHEAERLWTNLCQERLKKYGNYSPLHLDALFGYASFCNRTNKTSQFDSLKTVVNKHWVAAFEFPPSIGTDSSKKDSSYVIAEEMPRFPGCESDSVDNSEKKKCADQKLLRYIYNQINYPESAKENGIEGMAVVSFTVSEHGTICDAKILKNPGGATGEESLRVVQRMNEYPLRWRPGKMQGKLVRVRYNLPIRFKLH